MVLDCLICRVDLADDICQWLDFFFLKGIYVTRDIEVIVVLDDLFITFQMGKLVKLLT